MSANLDVLGGITDLAAYKQPCAVATLSDMTNTMTGLPVIDSYQLLGNDRVWVWQNDDPITNGIYNAQLGAWTRAIDFAFNSGVVTGTQVLVNNGATYGNVVFRVTTPDPIVIGSSPITSDTAVTPSSLPLRAPYREVTAGHTDTASINDGTIGWNVLYAGTKLQTIPNPATITAGQELTIMDTYGDCTVNPIRITPAVGTVNKTATLTMGTFPGSAPGMSLTLISNGVDNWALK